MSDAATASAIRLIVCDNDGCLLPEGNLPLDPVELAPIAARNRAAFGAPGPDGAWPSPVDLAESHRPAGLTVCSGRPQPFVELLLRIIHCPHVPAICESGVWLYSLAENRAERDPAIDEADLDALREAEAWIRRDLDWTLQAGKNAMLSVFVPDETDFPSRLDRLADEIARRGWPLRIERSVHYINVRIAGASKARGIGRLLEATGLQRAQILGIGDTAGDRAMREACGTFACPANADDEIKALADYVSPHPLLEGVVDIMARFAGPADPV